MRSGKDRVGTLFTEGFRGHFMVHGFYEDSETDLNAGNEEVLNLLRDLGMEF